MNVYVNYLSLEVGVTNVWHNNGDVVSLREEKRGLLFSVCDVKAASSPHKDPSFCTALFLLAFCSCTSNLWMR